MTWSIYGNKYDLTTFIDKHPGGKEILQKTKDLGDITPLFESYHAISDKDSIRKSLERYKVEEAGEDTYDFTLYNELCNQIKSKHSLKRSSIKSNYCKYLYCSTMSLLYIILNFICILDLIAINKILLGFLLGFIWLSLGFNIMHDASHYAYFKSPRLNNLASAAWSNCALANHGMWFYHHVLYHHAFTNTEKDSDMYSMVPMYRKRDYQMTWRFPLWFYPFMVYIFPGYYYGQCALYALSNVVGFVFHKDLKIQRGNYSKSDLLCFLFIFGVFYLRGFFASFAFMISCNFFYNINTVGDHETFDVLVENHYQGKDWLKLQVQHSANFKTDSPIYTYVFGGINYQIEHHLFPSMSNCFYRQIAPTIKEFCKEHGIPYVEHHSLVEVFQRYFKTLKYYNSKKNL
jgi:fatty acid desaturase